MWLVRSPLKSQELFGDGSRQVGFSTSIDSSLLVRLPGLGASRGDARSKKRQSSFEYWK